MTDEAHELDTWLVCGTSPSAARLFVPVMELYPHAVTIVANGAITLFSAMHVDPDFAWISDGWTAALFGFHIRSAKRRGKTVIVAPERVVESLSDHDIKVALSVDVVPSSGCSGTQITQIAIDNDAKRIALVGMDGYESTSSHVMIDTFDGRRGPNAGQLLNADRARHLQAMIDQNPDVAFEFYGEPHYEITGSNLIMFPDAEAV